MATMRRWSITLAVGVATAAVLIVGGLLLVGGSGDGGADAARAGTDTTPVPTPGASQSAPKIGPEGVPLLAGPPLGAPASPRAGSSSGGVPCGSHEQLRYHVHAHLTLFVNGKPRSVPYGVGIGAPREITKSPAGSFVAGGSCFSFLHTHAADGIVHIEAPGKATFKLGQFFDVWQQRLNRRHLGAVTGRVVAYLNGHRFRGDPAGIPLTKHAQIQLEVGRPLVAPTSIRFPSGL